MIIYEFQTEKINGEWREKECSGEIEQSHQHTTFQLINLDPDAVYRIELRAHNSIGQSSPAQIRIKTARGKKDKDYFSYAYSGTININCNYYYPLNLILLLLFYYYVRL